MAKRVILKGTPKELKPIITHLLAVHQMLEEMDLHPVYGIPVTTFQDIYRFHPQIKLMFYQMSNETTGDNRRVYGEITYRVVGETAETFSRANAERRAEAIKRLFVQPQPFEWKKGRDIVTYRDASNGYDFKLRVRNETEGRRIITQVLQIEGKTPDWKYLTISECRNTFPNVPETKLIFGEQRRMPRRRPVEDIKFRYAELHLFGVSKGITLVDTTGRRGTPLVRVA